MKESPEFDTLPKRESWPEIWGVSIGILFAALVFGHAWVHEDAFIAFRYIQNFFQGYGLVFNLNERVLGFSNPLYTLLLGSIGGWFGPLPLISVLLNFALTLTFIGLLLFIARKHLLPWQGVILILALLASSFSVVTYQTAGLSNSLAHCLILGLAFSVLTARPGASLLFCALLLTNRLDAVVYVGPVGLWAIFQIPGHWRVRLRTVFLAFTPLLAWLTFSLVYYGTLVPNTATAKITPFDSTMMFRALAYLADLAYAEPLPIMALGTCTTLLLWKAFIFAPDRKLCFSIAAAVPLSIFYFLWIGGDYFRGRLFTPLLVFVLLFTVQLFRQQLEQVRLAHFPAVLILLLLHFQHGKTLDHSRISKNEWQIYPKLALRNGLGQAKKHHWAKLGEQLKKKAARCGAFTIAHQNIGLLGFAAGPMVTILNTTGLTDAVTARLPSGRSWFPGHHHKPSVKSYWLSRHVTEVQTAKNGNCRQIRRSRRRLPFRNQEDERRVSELEQITRGPLFTWKRWSIILRHPFGYPLFDLSGEPPERGHRFDKISSRERQLPLVDAAPLGGPASTTSP